MKQNLKQECIPVGCVPPALYRMGGLPDRQPPPDRDPPGQRPSLDRHPPWTETPQDRDPPWTETPQDRDPSPGQRPHCEQNHRQVLKHYLPATSFAGGNETNSSVHALNLYHSKVPSSFASTSKLNIM